MLGPADVKIDAGSDFAARADCGSHPIAFGRFAAECLGILRVQVTQIIPATARPLRHGVGFADRAIRKIDPFFGTSERRPAIGCRLIIFERGRDDRELRFRQRFMIHAAVGILFPNDRKRLAPITLPAEQPIAQLIIDGAFANAAGFEPGCDDLLGFRGRFAVQRNVLA